MWPIRYVDNQSDSAIAGEFEGLCAAGAFRVRGNALEANGRWRSEIKS